MSRKGKPGEQQHRQAGEGKNPEPNAGSEWGGGLGIPEGVLGEG